MGLGANMAAISTLLVPMRRPGAFSQKSPPCMMAETMFDRRGEAEAIVDGGEK